MLKHSISKYKKEKLLEEEKQIRQRLRDDFEHYAAKCLKITTKTGSLESFIFNKVQKYANLMLDKQLNELGYVRALFLKGRQQGISTMVGGRFYHKTTHLTGIKAFILTHLDEATSNLYAMTQRYYENTPPLVKPEISASNAKELIFGKLQSGYKLGTAKNKAVGRSSTIHLLHGSEVAFWENAAEHAKGILQAVPGAPGTEIILESTANGVGNFFHEMWQKAEAGLSDYIAIFIPWFWQEEYRREVPSDFEPTEEEVELKALYNLSDEQIYWRRFKIIELTVRGEDGEKAFRQEYPCNANEAFQITGEDSYISSDIVMKSRKTKAEIFGPLLIGCDPARFGDDRTSIICRQGRVAFNLKSYTKKSTMEIVGILSQMINELKPVKVFIDIGGIGAGIVDRLNELYQGNDFIVGVNAGSCALNTKIYSNKRAEMWALTKNWLLDEPCQIPDSDTLHADLCGIKYTIDSNSRLVMEKKETMKKRGLRSPDEAEALINTFALPVTAFASKEKSNTVKNMANNFNQKLNAQRNALRQ